MVLQLTKATKALLLSCIAVFLTTTSFAQTSVTYTAVANGNYTSASTWAGGIVPAPNIGFALHGEHIVIPKGITVTVDTNLHWKTSGFNTDVEINGSLVGLPGYNLNLQTYMKGDALAVIDMDSITLWQQLTAYYYGNITANNLRLHDFNWAGGVLKVNKKLTIPDRSDSEIYTTLTLANHCTLQKRGWSSIKTASYQQYNGVINYPDTMTIIHNLMAKYTTHTNLDLDTNWFAKHVDTFIIDIDSNAGYAYIPATFSIKKDTYFDGVMIFRSGYLRLNQHKLTFGPNAKLYTTRTWGGFIPDANSDIEVQSNDLGGAIYFYEIPQFSLRSDTLRNFIVNMSSSTGSVSIGNGMTVAGTLDLQKGQLHLDSLQLKMQSGSSATITNASTNSYITSNFGGALHMDVAANATATFPVGTPAHYAPIDVKNNSSTEVYKVGAVAGVKDTVTTGFDIATQEPCVAATWWVNPSAATGSSADVTIKWPAALEVNSFDRSQSFITTYLHNQLKWDTQTTTSAAGTQGSFYTQTQTVNNFDTGKSNYFSVFDGMTSLQYLSINNVSLNGKVTLYPNPTSGNTTIGMILEHKQTIAVQLTDVSGRVVYNKAATPYTSGQHTLQLPTSTLTSGMYFVQLTNENGTLLNSGKLMKQ